MYFTMYFMHYIVYLYSPPVGVETAGERNYAPGALFDYKC